MPKVSVVIPNYNHVKYLNKRINSVLSQTFQDFEIILLDDNSTDDSRKILSTYNNHLKVSKILINTVNSGSTFLQWQKGIKEAVGEYIWIAESDDFADTLFLETLVAQLEQHPEVGIAYCQSFRIDENNAAMATCKDLYPSIACEIVYTGKDILLNYMAGANLIPNASAVVFRKEISDQIDNTYTKFKFSGDWWFWCELLLKSDIIHVCKELNYFRYHTNKVTISATKNGLYFIEGLQILELIKQKTNLPLRVYINKSKNFANAFINSQLLGTNQINIPFRVAFKVLWQASGINRTFVKRVFYLFLRSKLPKLKMIL